MEKVLTVIVPSYNAEAYIRHNLESFCIKRILDDIEILVINDGSYDHTADIAQEIVTRYPDSYKLINKENGGHGSGINCGIQNALGNYLKVVDADDWVDQDAFINLVEILKTCNADVIYSGFLWVFDNGESDMELCQRKAEFKEPFKHVVYQKKYVFDEVAEQLYMKMHNITIRTEILKGHQIQMDEHCYYVDTEFITYSIPYVKTICFINEFVYQYRIGHQGQSISLEKMQMNEQNYDRVLDSLFRFYRKLGKTILCSVEKKDYIARIIARVVAGKIKIMLSFPSSYSKKQELLRFDEKIRVSYPEIYEKNQNCAVHILRMNPYLLYYPASMLVKKKYK